MDYDRYKRQSDIVDVDVLNIPIHIIGVGGIGSWCALTCAKMGCQDITVYDMDEVENHNVASQFYRHDQLGQQKLDAIVQNVFDYTGTRILARSAQADGDIDKGIVIIAVDSMERRHELAEIYKDRDIYIIDGRMGGLQLEIYSVEASKYTQTLAPLDGVDHDACTARAISFNCAVIGGLVANQVRKFIQDGAVNKSFIFEFNNLMTLQEDFNNE